MSSLFYLVTFRQGILLLDFLAPSAELQLTFDIKLIIVKWMQVLTVDVSTVRILFVCQLQLSQHTAIFGEDAASCHITKDNIHIQCLLDLLDHVLLHGYLFIYLFFIMVYQVFSVTVSTNTHYFSFSFLLLFSVFFVGHQPQTSWFHYNYRYLLV